MTDTTPSAPARALADDERSELERYRQAFRELADASSRAAAGDLEARVGHLGDGHDLVTTRWAVNRLLDLTDAFVREAGASLQAASRSEYHREFLVDGFGGAFADGARTVNGAREAMASADEQVAAAHRARRSLADGFEAAVLSASEHVAAASTELGATASFLTGAAGEAVAATEQASGTIGELAASSEQIARVVDLIRDVASRTRMLALNATIEAARAGEAGRGFAVVAHEVKQLSDETRGAVDQIEREVTEVRQAARASSDVLTGIGERVRDMHEQAIGVATAVDGGHADLEGVGLARLAELLRSEATDFLSQLRA